MLLVLMRARRQTQREPLDRTSRERLALHPADACFAMAEQLRHQSDGSLLTVA
jgi:hypothetical protein